MHDFHLIGIRVDSRITMKGWNSRPEDPRPSSAGRPRTGEFEKAPFIVCTGENQTQVSVLSSTTVHSLNVKIIIEGGQHQRDNIRVPHSMCEIQRRALFFLVVCASGGR
jgi:hypothetical protein